MQPIEIKITSCKNPNLWYKDRVGTTHPATIVNGNAWVNNNPIFKVSQVDYEVIHEQNKDDFNPKYSAILALLRNNDLTAGEIHDRMPGSKYAGILCIVSLLKRKGLIETTGEKRTNKVTGYDTYIYTISSPDDIPPTVGGGYNQAEAEQWD